MNYLIKIISALLLTLSFQASFAAESPGYQEALDFYHLGLATVAEEINPTNVLVCLLPKNRVWVFAYTSGGNDETFKYSANLSSNKLTNTELINNKRPPIFSPEPESDTLIYKHIYLSVETVLVIEDKPQRAEYCVYSNFNSQDKW